MPVYLLALYRRGESMAFNSAERAEIRRIVNDLVDAYGKQNVVPFSSNGAA